jgi:glycosyltransferase involved in cell wall biosynthesis
MSLSPDISVIIPSNHGHHELLKVVHAICNQTVKPAEIMIVDSSGESGACPEEIIALCAISGIRLIYEHRAHAFPGHARNIGLGMVKGELIAFIDVQTIPRPHWLEVSLNLLTNNDAAGVWGATSFSSKTTFQRLVRDGFYGTLPRTTLPGTVCRRDVLNKVGKFVDWVRAGEDTEWMLRLKLHKVPVVCPPRASSDYIGLIDSTMKQLLKKWYRNYTASRDLPHFFPQRLLLWLVLYPLIVLIAFNWNYLIADWRMDSPLYIGHVTKIVAVLPGLGYLGVRGILLPLKRGVGIWRLLPFRFIAITGICFMADVVKVLVFSIPKSKNVAIVTPPKN